MTFKSRLQGFLQRFSEPLAPGKLFRLLLILFAVAAAIRILFAMPALAQPETLLRPDSMGYWNPALALAAGDGFVSAVGSDTPEVIRPIGYPLLLSLVIVIFGKSFFAAAITGIVAGASAVIPITLTVRKVAGDRWGLIAGGLFALSMTPVAAAPMILSDNLLGVIAAWQCCMAVYFCKEKKIHYFTILTLLAIIGSLVKPVNLPVVLFGLPVILIAGSCKLQQFLTGAAIMIFLTGVILLPYLYRNYRLCGGFDGNSPNLYFHNGSAIMAHATGESSEVWKNRLLAKAEKEFKNHPEQYPSLREQNTWKKARFAEMVRRYPRSSFITHLPNMFNLLPDVPAFLENNHVTTGERGTMAVLRQKGFFAAVKHYFGSKWPIIFLLIPFLAVHTFILLFAFCQLAKYIITWQWRWLLIFGVLVFYYILAPGPVVSPRYLLPALPMMIFMAVGFLSNTTYDKISKG